VEEGMSWTALANIATVGLLILLAAAAASTLAGLDRWLTDRKDRREADRFDVFTDGKWRR
jgi:hypothetical protein